MNYYRISRFYCVPQQEASAIGTIYQNFLTNLEPYVKEFNEPIRPYNLIKQIKMISSCNDDLTRKVDYLFSICVSDELKNYLTAHYPEAITIYQNHIETIETSLNKIEIDLENRSITIVNKRLNKTKKTAILEIELITEIDRLKSDEDALYQFIRQYFLFTV